MNRLKLLLGIVSAIITISATALYVGVNVKQAGPFYLSAFPYDSATIGGVGGVVKQYWTATNDTERIGNIVYLASKNLVNHSATLANYNAIEGVVVGGASTRMQATYVVADTGTIAALPGKAVLVLERGRAYVLADSAAGFSPGTQVLPSTRAGMGGRLNARGTAIDTFFRIFGKTVDSTVSGKAVLVDVRVR